MRPRSSLRREAPSRRSAETGLRAVQSAGSGSATHARPVVVELERAGGRRRAPTRSPHRSDAITDYGFLSDCRSAGLVSRTGSVDWLCWPRFDSPSLFAKVLDRDKGGAFAINPTARYSVERRYAPATNVLQTTFRTATGTARLTDWLNTGARQALCRLVECLEGRVELRVACDPRPRYGAVGNPGWERSLGYLVCAVSDDDRVILDGLSSSHETFTLEAGGSRSITLEGVSSSV